MAWKGRGLPELDFSSLIGSLNTSKLQQKDNAVYQVIWQLITKIQNQRDQLIIKFKDVADNITEIGDTVINVIAGLKDATFWTKNNETLNFPASIRVIAGLGISLDYTTANQVTISSTSTGGSLYVIIGEPPQIVSDGTGNGIILPFTLPMEIP